tara:strand:- start:561 stop:3308 length:2748 start_codon:yes stop_codon:yes gene_type:complete
MANLISKKVKSSKLPDTFFRLEDVEPSLGLPNDSNSIIVSVTNGDRTFYKLDSGFNFYNDSGARRIGIDLNQFGIADLNNVDDSDGLGNTIDGGKLLVFSAARNAFVPSVGGVSLDSNDAVTLNGEGPLYYLDARNHNHNQIVFDSNFGVRASSDSVTFNTNQFNVNNNISLNSVVIGDSLTVATLIRTSGNVIANGGFVGTSVGIDGYGSFTGNVIASTFTGDGSGLTNLTADSAVFADLATDLESAGFNTLFSDKTTTELTEGSNLYYTESRADSNITRFATVNDLQFSDNRKVTFGNDSDLKIFHNGSSNVYQGSSHVFRNTHGNDVITVDSDHAVLKYNGSSKLTVVDSGVEVTGNISATNMSLTGNLTITGTTTTVNTTTLQVSDPLIQFAVGNEASDIVDIGFFGHYSPDAGSTREHTGFFRDANNGQYYLFGKYQSTALDSVVPATTVDRTDATFGLAGLNIQELTADSATISGPIKFSNVYSTEGALPSAATYHGMFAHVHATGKGYFAHGGQWHKLLDETSSTTDNLPEGSTNFYHSDARARSSVTASNTTGFGGLSYDSSTGIFFLTRVDSDDVLSVYSAGNNITISPTGVIQASGAPQADNAALLDSLDALQFLRSDVDDVVDSGVQLTFKGSAKLAFGDSTGPAHFQYKSATGRVRWTGGLVDNFNADMVDSVQASQLLRSDVTSRKTAGQLIMNDNAQLILGTDSDLLMYHNGGAAVFRNNTGDFHLQTGGFLVKNVTGTETMIDAEPNSFVKLYYDNAPKLTTQTNGVKVTGTLEVTDKVKFVNGANTTEVSPTGVSITSNALAVVDTFTAGTGNASTVKYDVRIHDASTTPDETQISTVLVAFNGESDVGFTEFGVVHTGDSDMGFLTADVIGSGQIRLLFERRNGRGTLEVKTNKTIIS